MKRAALGVAWLLAAGVAEAQLWKPLGRGTVRAVDEVQTLFADTLHGRLLAGGTFNYYMNDEDTVLCMGQAAWNGVRWDSVATRPQSLPNGGHQPTYWFLEFQGRLYFCGAFSIPLANGEWTANHARLNEQENRWEPLDCNVHGANHLVTLTPKRPAEALYATGYHGELCGLPESSVFQYDGQSFQTWEPFEQIPEHHITYVGSVFDFKGYTYMTGYYKDPLTGNIISFMRWNGSTWEHVPGWGTLNAPIKDVFIHEGVLYVGGAFRKASGGPGNGVAAFDGEQWDELGGGVLNTNALGNTVVRGLAWYRGDLIAYGRFTLAGYEVVCPSLAKWDGERWCSFPGELRGRYDSHPTIGGVAVWRDSLYVCGTFLTVDGDTMRQVIQWLGTDETGDCSYVNVQETAPGPPGLTVTPLQAAGQWTVQMPYSSHWKIEAYNTAGQLARTWQGAHEQATIDLSGQPPGLYLLRAVSSLHERFHTKLLKP